jgi:hypothetical protein
MTTWTKYTFTCDPDECDTLIEVSCRDFGFPNGVTELTCPCGRKMNYLSYEDVTIPPITTTKEEQMETDATVSLEVNYNPDLLVTYKVLNGYSDPEYATDKVRNIEWDLHTSRQNSKTVSNLQSKINTVKNIITEAYADSDDQDTLRQIAEALDIELMRSVEWTATIEVSGTYEYDVLSEYDFDLDGEITDNLYVDSQSGAITIGDTEVCNVREAY